MYLASFKVIESIPECIEESYGTNYFNLESAIWKKRHEWKESE